MQFIHQYKRLISKHKSCVRQQAVLRKDKGGRAKQRRKKIQWKSKAWCVEGGGGKGLGGIGESDQLGRP